MTWFRFYLYILGLLEFSDSSVVEYGIPHIVHYGDFAGYKVLVMTKTGLTLHNLRYHTRSSKFCMKTICKIAMQAVINNEAF